MEYLKREAKELYERLGKLYLILVFALFVVAVLPRSVEVEGRVIYHTLFLALSMFFFVCTFVQLFYPIYNIVKFVKAEINTKKNRNMEKLEFYKAGIAKVIGNVVVYGSGIFFGNLAGFLLSQFQLDHVSYFDLELKVSITRSIVEFSIFLPIIIGYIYLSLRRRYRYNVLFFSLVIAYFIEEGIMSLQMELIWLLLVELLLAAVAYWGIENVRTKEFR